MSGDLIHSLRLPRDRIAILRAPPDLDLNDIKAMEIQLEAIM